MRAKPERQAKPARILIATSSLRGGGAERAAAALANAWSARGREVRVVTLGPVSEGDYPLASGVSRVALDLKHGGGAATGRLTDNLRAVAAYRREIERFRPDTVLGMITATNVTVALAALGLRCRVVGSERAAPAHDPITAPWRVLRRFAYGLLDAVTAQTDGAADWLRRNTFARRVVVVPNAIALPIPDHAPALAPADVCPDTAHVLLGVGRLHPVKQFDLLIEAFAQVAAARPDWTLVLLGDGPERARLERRVQELGLNERVRLPGRAGNMTAWYERASLIALTSDHEGFPNVLLEAMAHGVPVVSMDCPDGPRAMVRHGVDGLLTPPGEVAGFAEALGELTGDSVRRARLAEAAREVLERFSEDDVMRRWDAIIAPGARS